MQNGDVVYLNSSSIPVSAYQELRQRVWDTGAGRKLPIPGLPVLIHPCKVCDQMKELRVPCGLALAGEIGFEITWHVLVP